MITPFMWIGMAFLSGALPFAVWLGQGVTQKDIRTVGDGNPGAFNVARAAGPYWGFVAIVLDVSKGAIPVGLAHYVAHLPEGVVTAVAIAPILGHAFSPFLRFRGGKALAVTLGVWTGLTLWRVPLLIGALCFFWIWALPHNHRRAVLAIILSLALFFGVIGVPVQWWLLLGAVVLIVGGKQIFSPA